MSKILVGDYVEDEHGRRGYVVECRGGYVGRWLVRLDSGETLYRSSRDIAVLVPSVSRRSEQASRRLTVNEKLDLLFDYLGIEIEDTPKIVKRSTDDKIQSN
jgi:hypothetical protein